MTETQQPIHEIVQNREIERKFSLDRHTAEALMGALAHRAVNIEQHYLDEYDSEYELRVRSVEGNDFSACLKSQGDLERLELEVPISEGAFEAHASRSTASLYKKRVDLGEGACLDFFNETDERILEVEYPSKDVAESFQPKNPADYKDIRIRPKAKPKSSRQMAEQGARNLPAESKGTWDLVPRDSTQLVLGKIALEMPKQDRPFVIGLAGPSASGKSSFIRKVEDLFGPSNVSSLCLDNYIPGKRFLQKEHGVSEWENWDLPEVYDTKKAAEDLKKLISGERIASPVFDFERGEPKEHEFSRLNPSPILIFEGLYSLADEFDSLIDKPIYLDAPIEQRIVRRIERDVQRCRWSPERIFQYMMEHAEPARYQYIEPQKQKAEFVLGG